MSPACSREVGLRPKGGRPLPARVLRRPAPAHRLRPRARPQPPPHRRRRARLGTRRLHPVPDPQPDEGLQQPTASPTSSSRTTSPCSSTSPTASASCTSASSSRSAPPRRSTRHACAPLHPGPYRHDPRPRSVLAAARRGHAHLRGAPLGADAAFRLPLPYPLPGRPGPLRAPRSRRCGSFGGDHMAACHFPLQEPVAGATWPRLGTQRDPAVASRVSSRLRRRAFFTRLQAALGTPGSLTNSDWTPAGRGAVSQRQACRKTGDWACQRRWRRTSKASRSASPM